MSSAAPRTGNVGLWIGLCLGGPVIAFGIAGVLEDSRQTHPVELATWIVGGAVVHDVVLVPIVLGSSWVLARLAGGRPWRAARWAIATSAILAVVAWPFVRGYGRNPTIPSLLPRNYATGLAAYVLAVWLTAAAIWLAGRRRRDR